MRHSPRKSGKALAVLLAVGVHAGLALFLIFGVRWQNQQPETMMVELVPPPAPVIRQAPPKPDVKPDPKPEPAPEPPPPTPPPPKPEPAPVPKADIALKQKQEKERIEREAQDKAQQEKTKQEKLAREQREREMRDMAKKESDKRERELKELAKREADKRSLAETKLAQDRAQAEVDERKRREEQARVERDQRAQRDRAMAAEAASKAATTKAFDDYVGRIQAKIKGNVILPPEITGNPEAVFDIVQLPTGEIISAELNKSSGVRVYDEAVSRAILKSSPLPVSNDHFQRTLRLKFRPQL